MVARNVVVSFRTTNPFRSRFDSGHRQIGDLPGSIPAVRVIFFWIISLFTMNRIDFFLVSGSKNKDINYIQ